jgi:hypothetical protein
VLSKTEDFKRVDKIKNLSLQEKEQSLIAELQKLRGG